MDGLAGAGVVVPHRRVYAARALAPMIVERPVRHIIIDGTDLFGGLPETPIAPATREPRKRPKIAERYGPQEVLPLDCAPTVIELLPRLGATHQAIGKKLGISRQQASNIIVGRFRPSRRVIVRVLELARAA
jgi:hypothetical protein